jgi:hypothetical protein
MNVITAPRICNRVTTITVAQVAIAQIMTVSRMVAIIGVNTRIIASIVIIRIDLQCIDIIMHVTTTRGSPCVLRTITDTQWCIAIITSLSMYRRVRD